MLEYWNSGMLEGGMENGGGRMAKRRMEKRFVEIFLHPPEVPPSREDF